jgi:hypothetical protein
MPYAEKIVEVPLSGPVVTLVDNTAQIDEQIMLWNAEQGWPAVCSSSGGAGSVGSGGQGGTRNVIYGDDIVYPAGNSDGCGCSVPRGGSAFGGYLTLAAAAVNLIRRRHRRRT